MEFGRIDHRAADAAGEDPDQPIHQKTAKGDHEIYIYPNTTFTYADAIDGNTPIFAMYRLFPGDQVGKAVALSTTYKPGAAAESDDKAFAELHDTVLDIVRNEDFVVAAGVWQSLQYAPPDMELVFGRNELMLQVCHRGLAEATGMPL